MKNTFKNIKIGQKVFSITYGAGRVAKLFDDVFTVEFAIKSSISKEIPILKDEFSFSYNGAFEGSWTGRPEVFLKKPVITTKARLNALKRLSIKKQSRSIIETNLEKLKKEVNFGLLSMSEGIELKTLFKMAEDIVLNNDEMDSFTDLLKKGGVNV